MITLGLDIGGASIKAATSAGWVRSARFPLWRTPDLLADAIATLCESVAFDRVALTMTGELCDAFETKEDGVRRILESTSSAFGSATPLRVWQTTGSFCDAKHASETPWQTAAANWLALATFAGQLAPCHQALLIDIGSTTTDIIPIKESLPVPRGRTDPERLVSRELVYHGVRRTPLSSIRQSVTLNDIEYPLMRELFATSLDAYLVTGDVAENPDESDTADNRAETIPFAIDRLARMIGSDRTRFTKENAEHVAEQLRESQIRDVKEALLTVKRATSLDDVEVVITSGEGEFLARRIIVGIEELQHVRVISLAEQLTPDTSRAACAYAVAMLADQLIGE